MGTLTEITRFEIINFLHADDNSNTINFITEQGYLTYGPYDDFGNKIPNAYDMVFIFSDQVKLLVDNIRAGFIIKELTGYGEAVVVDTDYETTKLRCIRISDFYKTNYTKDEYYFRVPEYKNIVNYLAEYDREFEFLPEVLTVFQRLLLDEIHDTIKRLRDMRSIQKVDSVNINRLLFLLGCNLNIKTLTKKQRRELIEELNEFYRIVGTRNSYNLLNILQNDLKLINIEQLFTPYGEVVSGNKEISYDYTCRVNNGGTGYANGQTYKLRDFPSIQGQVTNTVGNGAISINGFDLYSYTGSDEINGTYDIVSNKSCVVDITSTPKLYQYNDTLIRGEGYTQGQVLRTADNKFTVTVNSVTGNGSINTYTLNPTTGTTSLSKTNETLYISGSTAAGVRIYSEIQDRQTVLDTTISQVTPGNIYNLELEPGMYEYEICGASGGGAAGLSEGYDGLSRKVNTTDGSPGYIERGTFVVNNTSFISYNVGAGGQGGYVIDTSVSQCRSGLGGVGNQSGATGGNPMYHNYSRRVIFTDRHTYMYGAAGGGGGSSSITLPNNQVKIAAGGQGGSAQYSNSSIGGIGGNNGTTGGTGVSGGASSSIGLSLQTANIHSGYTATGENGSNGWIKIKRIIYTYTPQLQGNYQNVPNNTYHFTGSNYGQDITLELTTVSGTKKANVRSVIPELPIDQTFSLNTNQSAKLSITSTVREYKYDFDLKSIEGEQYLSDYYYEEFKTDTSPQRFTITYKKTNYSNPWTISPSTGTTPFNFTNEIAKHIRFYNGDQSYPDGTGATVTIGSTENETILEDRCYIDFYTKQELGAELKEEYRIPVTDYGYITQGTPNSPIWWEVGLPDINYGPLFNFDEYEEENYGLITTKIIGEWVQWWVWDRQSIWYPTNHVAIELKMPTNIDFREYTETFVEQFYKIASTVVYIHHIIESFLFGNETELGSDDTGIEDAATLGIATGAPVVDYEMTFSSNPLVQYTERIPATCTLTINPTPSDATVTIIRNSGTQTYTGQTVITANYGEKISWAVSKTNYAMKKSEVACIMTKDITKYVTLSPTKYSVTITSVVENANISLSASGYTTVNNTYQEYNPNTQQWENKLAPGATIKVLPNTAVNYTISKSGYTTITGTIVATDNIAFNGELFTL